VILRLAPLLAAQGVEQVLAAPSESAIARAWSAAGFTHVPLEVPSDRFVRTPNGRISPRYAAREMWRTWLMARRTAHLARVCGANVIHANSHWSHLEGVIAARLVGVRALVHLHEENEHDIIGRLRQVAVLTADATVAVSAAVAESLPPAARRRTLVIRNGVDTEAFAPGPGRADIRQELGCDPEAPIVLALSRLDPAKGVDNAIRAVADLPEDLSHVQLAIAGAACLDRSATEQLLALGSTLLGDRVRFLGVRSDVADILRASDALIVASPREGLPLTVLEAQACGLPVVAFPSGGVPEVVAHERTGLLAAQGDVVDLTSQLARLLRDSDLRACIAANARSQVVAQGSLQGQADRHVALLRELLARRRAEPGSTPAPL
jgi:glycosyltransferase involved in cell wall biosynthesis